MTRDREPVNAAQLTLLRALADPRPLSELARDLERTESQLRGEVVQLQAALRHAEPARILDAGIALDMVLARSAAYRTRGAVGKLREALLRPEGSTAVGKRLAERWELLHFGVHRAALYSDEDAAGADEVYERLIALAYAEVTAADLEPAPVALAAVAAAQSAAPVRVVAARGRRYSRALLLPVGLAAALMLFLMKPDGQRSSVSKGGTAPPPPALEVVCAPSQAQTAADIIRSAAPQVRCPLGSLLAATVTVPVAAWATIISVFLEPGREAVVMFDVGRAPRTLPFVPQQVERGRKIVLGPQPVTLWMLALDRPLTAAEQRESATRIRAALRSPRAADVLESYLPAGLDAERSYRTTIRISGDTEPAR